MNKILVLTLTLFLTGCASEQITPSTADSIGSTNYAPNVTAMQIGQGAQSVGALLPPPYGNLADLVGGLIIAVSTTIAYRKNQQAAQHSAAAAALASAIVNNPPLQSAAMTAAAQNGSQAVVSQHIASASSPV